VNTLLAILLLAPEAIALLGMAAIITKEVYWGESWDIQLANWIRKPRTTPAVNPPALVRAGMYDRQH
jgi:hypothetical protein